MALQALKLDDLTWDVMVKAVRSRIAAASNGSWSLHAPVDPGVTFIELYAWLLEQRLYWLDQVPDSLTLAALNLLGLKPEQARLAGMVLQVPSGSEIVPRTTRFRLEAPGSTLTFTSGRSLQLLPVSALRISTGARDLTADVESERNPEVFAVEKEVRIVFAVSGPLPAPNVARAAVLIELLAPEPIPAQWSPDRVDRVGPAAALEWSYSTAAGLQLFSPGALEDGTLGFRRSGLVRFRVPSDWAPENGKLSLVVRQGRGEFASPPRLKAIRANVLIARHQVKVQKEAETLDWAPLPGNVLETKGPGEPLNSTVRVQLRERGGDWHLWKPLADLTLSSPADRVVLPDRESGLLRFGNGLAGRLPVPIRDGAPNAKVRARFGGGPDGNVGVNRGWREWMESVPGRPLFTAVNVTPGAGGREMETPAAARSRASEILSRSERAVLALDFESLAKSTPGVAIARAHAAIGHHPDFPCIVFAGAVTVFIVPAVPRPIDLSQQEDFTWIPAPIPDQGAMAAVVGHLDAARLLCTQVFVRAVTYRPVRLAIAIGSDQNDAVELRTQLEHGLRAALDPLGGESEPSSLWPFGEPVRPSAMRRITQSILADRADVLDLAIGLDAGEPIERCNDVEINPHELVYLASLAMEVRPVQLSSGGLR